MRWGQADSELPVFYQIDTDDLLRRLLPGQRHPPPEWYRPVNWPNDRRERHVKTCGTRCLGLRVSCALGWRLLVVVAALYVIGLVVGYLAAVVVPVAIALPLAALLAPPVHWLQARPMPRGVATAAVMIGGLTLLGGVLSFVIVTFVGT
jgi:hypothetical protein